MNKPRIITHVLLTSLVTVGSVLMHASDAIAGEPLAWSRMLLAVCLAGGMLHGSFSARKRGETNTADFLLKWTTAATAILAIDAISTAVD